MLSGYCAGVVHLSPVCVSPAGPAPDGAGPEGLTRRRPFLRGAPGAGVTGAIAGAAAGAGAGYAYRSSQAAPPGQVFDASLVEGRLPAVP
jgi:hypothetical protein